MSTHGDAKKLEAQQQGAPMAAGGPPSPAGSPPGGAGGPIPAPPPGGVFGPTGRSAESPLAGAAPRASAIAEDVQGFLQVLYSQFPHPAIGSLLERGRGQG